MAGPILDDFAFALAYPERHPTWKLDCLRSDANFAGRYEEEDQLRALVRERERERAERIGHPFQVAETPFRPAHFYVSVRSGARTALLLGPYPTKAEAEANVARGRQLAEARDTFSCFYEFGTAGSEVAQKTIFGT